MTGFVPKMKIPDYKRETAKIITLEILNIFRMIRC